jgi:nucleoside-diphosphate-sugar epimerase
VPKFRKVLVTGGAGFIGSHVVDRLVNDAYSVRIIDNLSTGKLMNINPHFGKGAVDFVRGDIRDSELVRKCVHDVDAVVHLAAITSVPFSVKQPQLTYETNVNGTLNLLNSCAEEKVEKFIFISSCSVYGEPKYLPVDELHSTNPISPYAESKLVGERYCLDFNKKCVLKSVVLRLFNVYGPRQGINDYSGVITKFIANTKQKTPLIIYGDGSQSRDFVNVHDVSQAVLQALKNEAAEGEIFNIGFGASTSLNELAKYVLELADSNLDIFYDQPRSGDIKNTFANISKAEKFLDYKPRFSLKAGLNSLFSAESQLQIVTELTSEAYYV